MLIINRFIGTALLAALQKNLGLRLLLMTSTTAVMGVTGSVLAQDQLLPLQHQTHQHEQQDVQKHEHPIPSEPQHLAHMQHAAVQPSSAVHNHLPANSAINHVSSATTFSSTSVPINPTLHEHGSEVYSSLSVQALLSQSQAQQALNRTQQDYLLDGWLGSDQHKAFVQANLEQQSGQSIQQRVQVGYRRLWSDYWDSTWALGYRNDIGAGSGQTALVMGAQGLAPYFVDSKLQLWLGEQRLALLNVELSREFWLTQRMTLEPFIDADYLMRASAGQATSENPQNEHRAVGWSHVKTGLQAHYVWHPDVQPYLTLYHLHEQTLEHSENTWRYGVGLMLRF